MTADPAGQELNIGERVDYTREHLPATRRERYEHSLREATELYQVLAVTPLPGQSDLDVQPHPWLPNIYTVPFMDGHMV